MFPYTDCDPNAFDQVGNGGVDIEGTLPGDVARANANNGCEIRSTNPIVCLSNGQWQTTDVEIDQRGESQMYCIHSKLLSKL